MPAQTRCSSRSSPSVATSDRRARRITSSRSNASARMSGPVRHGTTGVADQLHHRGRKADGDDVVEAEDHGGAPGRLAPAFARLVGMPRARHPHVRVERDSPLEADDEVFPVRVDRLDLSALQTRDGLGAGIAYYLPSDSPPQSGCGPPDRVAFRQGPAGVPARARPPWEWCRIQRRAATPHAASL
jgi:hypothetical protein